MKYLLGGEAPFQVLSPRQGRIFLVKCQLTSVDPKNLVHTPDLFAKRDFSKTHSQTQRMYSWIGRDLIQGKLLRSQLNSQILNNLHFSDPFTPIFDKPF